MLLADWVIVDYCVVIATVLRTFVAHFTALYLLYDKRMLVREL